MNRWANFFQDEIGITHEIGEDPNNMFGHGNGVFLRSLKMLPPDFLAFLAVLLFEKNIKNLRTLDEHCVK